MANDDFSEPPRRADSKIPVFIFFADFFFWVWVTSEAWGSVSVGFWGARQLSPFWSGGGSIDQGALLTLVPFQLNSFVFVSLFTIVCMRLVVSTAFG